MDSIKFSLIIPVAPNRDAEILKSIKNLDYDHKKIEVIVKNGTNPSKNRNDAAKEAKGEFLVLLDDDAVIKKNYLKLLDNIIKKYHPLALGGPQLTPHDDNYFGKASGHILTSFIATHNMSNRYKRGKINKNANEFYFTSANFCISREVYLSLNGFNETLFPGEDPEFFSRLKDKGINILYHPMMIIYHRRRSDLLSMSKQFFLYGLVRIKKEKISKTNSLIFYIPSLFVIYLILLPFLYLITPLLVLPFFIYLAIIIATSLDLSFKNHLKYLILYPFLFFIVHISYGGGMLFSLFHK